MTVWVEGNQGFYLGGAAAMVEEDREIASDWAKKHIRSWPDRSWVIGRFVEADRANQNRQLFSLEGLQMNGASVEHSPMNLNHFQRRVVGLPTAAELVYPTEDAGLNPFIETLGVVWKAYFPDEYALIQRAHAEGQLAFSMEAVPERIQCAGDGGCGAEFAYAGRNHESYCEHLKEGASDKFLINPLFTAGAILVAGVKPGWKNADVHSLVAAHSDLNEKIYAGIQDEFPHLSPAQWESLMAALLRKAEEPSLA